jgi:hypothetical protein
LLTLGRRSLKMLLRDCFPEVRGKFLVQMTLCSLFHLSISDWLSFLMIRCFCVGFWKSGLFFSLSLYAQKVGVGAADACKLRCGETNGKRESFICSSPRSGKRLCQKKKKGRGKFYLDCLLIYLGGVVRSESLLQNCEKKGFCCGGEVFFRIPYEISGKVSTIGLPPLPALERLGLGVLYVQPTTSNVTCPIAPPQRERIYHPFPANLGKGCCQKKCFWLACRFFCVASRLGKRFACSSSLATGIQTLVWKDFFFVPFSDPFQFHRPQASYLGLCCTGGVRKGSK